ncbi:MAG TPA: N-acetylmuramoyl-L-alanine amidase-like domain-containing protein [Ignavibacteriales bacterium]|nr:N-acetylmuramoyl-L-alanine amidase-like domain-containing protein [Ignavibacteriales bacterium]
MMRILTLLTATVLITAMSYSQTVYTPKDKEICQEKFTLAVEKDLNKKPINDVIAEIGKSFLGLNYEAHTLESQGKEQLVVHLTGLDCTTFLENALVFARCIKSGKTSFDDYQAELTKIRYRQGKLNGYPSRLHYFSDWIFDNDSKGVVRDVTKQIGGKPYNKKINFMTKNRREYAQISKNDENYKAIKDVESKINSREHYYIPKEDIKNVEGKIKNGYLIAITSGLEGMDIAHVGIAVKLDDGRIHFMHAPIVGSKVQITDKPLADYLMKNRKQTGIMVMEPLEP